MNTKCKWRNSKRDGKLSKLGTTKLLNTNQDLNMKEDEQTQMAVDSRETHR